MNINRNDLLKSELKAKYNLTDAEISQIDLSFDQLVESISLKTQQGKEQVAREVEASMTYVQSKML